MWPYDHSILNKWVEARKKLLSRRTFLPIYSNPRCVCLPWKDGYFATPWSQSTKQAVGSWYQALDFLLRNKCTLEMWCMHANVANQVPTSPVKTLTMFGSSLFWIARTPTYNWPTDKPNQCMAIGKKLWIIAMFSDIFWNYKNVNDNNRITHLFSNSYTEVVIS